MDKIPCALTIGGSDSCGGAGIQADLKTFAALRVHGMSALTSITAQNTTAITAIQDIETTVIKAQIEAVVEDIDVSAAKTGMLHTSSIIKTVSEEVKKYRFPLVVDPVMIAKSGVHLLRPEAIGILVNKLLPLATVITPNAMEAEELSKIKIITIENAQEAAQRISSLGPKAVVVKGGHIFSSKKAIDILYYEGKFNSFEAKRYDTKTTHGTGCSFSAAITAELAKGRGVVEAVSVAKEFVNRAIRFGLPIGHGYGPLNPMAHLYNEAEKYYVLKNVKDAVRILEEDPKVSILVPEVRMNLVMALSYATTPQDVAGVLGRIMKFERGVRASGCPEFGCSKHVAKTVLAVMKHDSSVRGALNICYSERLVRLCERLGLVTSYYDRREEPEEVKSVEGMTTTWGVEEAVKKIEKVPDIIYHFGDWGKEPMITLLGKSAVEVSKVAVRLARELQKTV